MAFNISELLATIKRTQSDHKATIKRMASESLANGYRIAANKTKNRSESLCEWLANRVANDKRLWFMVYGLWLLLYQGAKFNIYNSRGDSI